MQWKLICCTFHDSMGLWQANHSGIMGWHSCACWCDGMAICWLGTSSWVPCWCCGPCCCTAAKASPCDWAPPCNWDPWDCSWGTCQVIACWDQACSFTTCICPSGWRTLCPCYNGCAMPPVGQVTHQTSGYFEDSHYQGDGWT